MKIQLLGRQPNDITRRARLDDRRRSEGPPKLRDLPLHLRDRGDGRSSGVEIVGESFDRHDPVRAQEQDRQGCALPRPPKSDWRVVTNDVERAEDAELEDGTTVAAR